ncbi:MAG: NAD-dependent epimerase/dehydratase family protein, partial [Cytophagia bacterium]|nr:NAD-dependent epimerase/dehydratase family protein [Cytophagia bacterium]
MEKVKIKIIITGATGMVGEGVLHEALKSPFIEEVLVIGRKPTGYAHPKLKEFQLLDFYKPEGLNDLIREYDACLFCLGVSSIGMKEEEFTLKTHTLTIGFATVLAKSNPNMTFSYISGSATDSTEKGAVMWARVKGKTENDLAKLGFKNTFAFRPGYLQP